MRSWSRGVRVRHDGFTIIEVVVAITVLVVALLGAALLFENAIIVSGNTRNRVVAANLATQQIENVRGHRGRPDEVHDDPAGPDASRPRRSTACSSRSPRRAVRRPELDAELVRQPRLEQRPDHAGDRDGHVAGHGRHEAGEVR